MHPRSSKNKLGFTIIEVMIATSIIIVGILSVLSLVRQGIRTNYLNKNAIVASQLSQECLELVRKKRDFNWLDLENREWDENLDVGKYIIDHNDPIGAALTAVTGIEDNRTILKINNNSINPDLVGFYDHDTEGSSTPYRRMLEISNKTDEGFMASCLVDYRKEGESYDYVAADYLYDWLW